MGRTKVYLDNPGPYIYLPKRRYGFFNFIFDVFMTFATCGLWLIWIIIREWRNN